MQKNNNIDQYAIVAKNAYTNVVENKLSFEEGWQSVAAKIEVNLTQPGIAACY